MSRGTIAVFTVWCQCVLAGDCMLFWLRNNIESRGFQTTGHRSQWELTRGSGALNTCVVYKCRIVSRISESAL